MPCWPGPAASRCCSGDPAPAGSGPLHPGRRAHAPRAGGVGVRGVRIAALPVMASPAGRAIFPALAAHVDKHGGAAHRGRGRGGRPGARARVGAGGPRDVRGLAAPEGRRAARQAGEDARSSAAPAGRVRGPPGACPGPRRRRCSCSSPTTATRRAARGRGRPGLPPARPRRPTWMTPSAGLSDEISRAQETLARALGRARIGEDRALANLVRELGERLAHLLGPAAHDAPALARQQRLQQAGRGPANDPGAAPRPAGLGPPGRRRGPGLRERHQDPQRGQGVEHFRARRRAAAAQRRRHHLPPPARRPGDSSPRRLPGGSGRPDGAAQRPREGVARGRGQRLELAGRFRFRMASEDTREARDRGTS